MALEDDINLLASQPLLGALGREALRLLAFSAEQRTLRAGDTLFRRGDLSDGGYLVARGALALHARGDGRGEPDRVVGPGTLLGELTLVSDMRRPATAIARETTLVLRLSRVLFRRTLDEYPEAAQHVASLLAERVADIRAELDAVGARLNGETPTPDTAAD